MDAGLLDVLHDAADHDRAGLVGDAIDVDLLGVLEEAIDQDRPIVRHVDGARHVAIERGHVVDDRHRASAEHVRRPHHHREADLRRHFARLGLRRRRAARRLRNAEIPQQLVEPLPILGEVDRVRRRAENRDAGFLQRQRQLQRRLAAELHHARHVDVAFALALDHRHHVLERQRLEVEPIGGVVVGRHRLGIAVDHHGLEPLGLEAEHRVTAAVIELDALADAVGAAAEDDDLLLVGRIGLAAVFEAAVEIRRERLELGGAGVDALERGAAASARCASRAPRSRRRRGCRPARDRRSRRA